MRLIKCATFELEEFLGSNIPKYAILSHTWGNEEVSFAEFKSDLNSVRSKEGFSKINSSCAQALRDGLHYIWVDTCCIDKSSSSELSEAINSMFQWYKRSTICYAYLSDVTLETFLVSFPQSRWYCRGWTLQELLAPKKLVFYDRDWHGLGTKQDHADWISRFTRIDVGALLDETWYDRAADLITPAGLGVFCVAKRMSWASDRETTRVEDAAYCLLGIFDVNMPLLYGEGDRAFIRLQEEIIKSCDDDSILAWGLDTEADDDFDVPEKIMDAVYGGATPEETLAPSPEYFRDCHELKYAAASPSPFVMTNLGLQIELPLVPIRAMHSIPLAHEAGDILGWIGLLTCGGPSDEYLLGIVLWPEAHGMTIPGKVLRVLFGLSKQTVLVGARVAAEAVLSKITILRNNDSQSARKYSYGTRQIMINEGETISWLGLDENNKPAALYAFATDVLDEHPGHFYKWNPVTAVLTVKNQFSGCDLITINFDVRNGYVNPFSVLIRGPRAMVRKGLTFSPLEQTEIYELLSHENKQKDIDDFVLVGRNGILYRVTVEMTEKTVCSWKIIEVNIDAVRLMKGKNINGVRVDDGKNVDAVSIDTSQDGSVESCAELSDRNSGL
ncbi:hypothetical protein GLAREA_03431 [Glarea lozoyensis ATCC 20868]|uniref:Uncharacterized protein n=1 Tax=Glarea lozoyensis (strain ATCC 20868 / MF5171) TaxID=1116229 RepID=S3CZY2_GLAL2|nr:uncharacterized protein GLAREA_03431 [Glarea lozoyensis ATCC 20868]EPE30464.1 hypothetical protein GLAREA_03431 [Glarea lozoyensis ATCC 20868]